MYVFREGYRAPQGLFNRVLTDDCTGDVTSFVTATPAASMARIAKTGRHSASPPGETCRTRNIQAELLFDRLPPSRNRTYARGEPFSRRSRNLLR